MELSDAEYELNCPTASKDSCDIDGPAGVTSASERRGKMVPVGRQSNSLIGMGTEDGSLSDFFSFGGSLSDVFSVGFAN